MPKYLSKNAIEGSVMTNQTTAAHIAMLILLSILWAGTFVFVKIADASLNPYTIMAARAVVSAVFLWLVLPLSGRPLFSYFKNYRYQLTCFCSAILIAYMWLTIAFSEKVLSASMASLLITALVPITWFIAVFILREKTFYSLNALGIVIATLGMMVIIGFNNIFHADHVLWATLLYISGLISFAFAATANKRLAPNIDPLITITFNLFYIAIILVIAAFIKTNPLQDHFTTKNVIALFALGAGSTGIGYLIYFYLSHKAGLVYAALSSYLVPIFGFMMGIIFLQESFSWLQACGLLIVFIGVCLMQNKSKSA